MDMEYENQHTMTSKHTDVWRLAMAKLLEVCDEDAVTEENEAGSHNELAQHATLEKQIVKARREIAEVQELLRSALFLLDHSRGKHAKVAQKDFVMLEVATALREAIRKQDIMSLFPKEKRNGKQR